MMKSAALLVLSSAILLAAGDYKAESGGAPPSQLAPDIQKVLQKQGTKVVGSDGNVFAEVWFREGLPEGTPSTEMGVTLQNIALSGLVGAIQFPGQGADRRGQLIQPGVYTMRFYPHPVDGAHQGVALQRDFLILVPAAVDTDLKATPDYDDLMKLSSKASGTPHPAALEVWKDDAPAPGKLEKLGDVDWVLHGDLGGTAIAMVVVGKAAEH
jgi:hypothetical protein